MKIEIEPYQLGLFAIALLAGLVVRYYAGKIKDAWEEHVRLLRLQAQKLSDIHAAMPEHAGIKSLAENLAATASIPVYLEGIRKVCVLLVTHTEGLNSSVVNFRSALFTGGSTETSTIRSPGPAFMEHDGEAAFREGELQALVADGVPREQAEQRVKAMELELQQQRGM